MRFLLVLIAARAAAMPPAHASGKVLRYAFEAAETSFDPSIARNAPMPQVA